MRIYGLDFTSAPRPRKPITCAAAEFDGALLRITDVATLPDFAAFEAFLAQPGPWIAGFDFPFGQPARLIDALGWGASWADMVRHVAALGKPGFEAAIAAYRDAQPRGQKHPRRVTDVRSGSVSPLMLAGVPVGKMFFQGAPRLLAAGVHVAPCHPTRDSRVALETYPALVARRWIGAQSYKTDTRAKQTDARRFAREQIVRGLFADCWSAYGFELAGEEALPARLAADPSGDTLDAVLCAVQAAWASTQPGYGIPPEIDPREGWIVDPGQPPVRYRTDEETSMSDTLHPGLTGTATVTVTDDLTAAALGSGNVAVYSTPALIALLEAAAIDALAGLLAPGQTSVGTRLDVRHLAATPVGMSVTARATLTTVDGRRLVFAVEAHDAVEKIGEGTHERFIVDQAKFEARVRGKGA